MNARALPLPLAFLRAPSPRITPPPGARALDTGTAAALRRALALYAQPARAGEVRREPLPAADFDLLIECVLEPRTGAEVAAVLQLPPAQLTAALPFYLEQVLFVPGADPWRTLGLAPHSDPDALHHRLQQLQRWLAPAPAGDALRAVHWAQVRRAAARLHGDAMAPAPALRHAHAPAGRRIVLALIAVALAVALLALSRGWHPGRVAAPGPVVPSQPRAAAAAAPPSLPPPMPVRAVVPRVGLPRASTLSVGVPLPARPYRFVFGPVLPHPPARGVADMAPPRGAGITAPPGPAAAMVARMPPPRPGAAAARAQAGDRTGIGVPPAPVEAGSFGTAAPAPAVPAPTRDAAGIAGLLRTFSARYAQGEITAFMRLFTPDVRAGGQNYATLRASYARLFAATRARSVHIESVRVQRYSGAQATLVLRYEAQVLAIDAREPARYRGTLTLDLRSEDGAWRIAMLQRAPAPDVVASR